MAGRQAWRVEDIGLETALTVTFLKLTLELVKLESVHLLEGLLKIALLRFKLEKLLLQQPI